MRRFAPLAFTALLACHGKISVGDGGVHDGGGDLAAHTGDDADTQNLCNPPQVMILLDRTGTMHRMIDGTSPPDTPDGIASTKIAQATAAIQQVVTTQGIDQSVQFGLSLFPEDPGSCLSLDAVLQGQAFMNPSCQAGQVVVSPALSTGATIAGDIGPDKTTICVSTPTGAGLQTAYQALASIKQSGIDQYIMLVTDGADFYLSCPDPDPIEVLRTLDAAGVKTFIVGFGAQDTTMYGTNPPMLNRMACAGHTAKNFATACAMADGGGYDAVDPNGATLYYDASDSGTLVTGLQSIAQSVCCNCIF